MDTLLIWETSVNVKGVTHSLGPMFASKGKKQTQEKMSFKGQYRAYIWYNHTILLFSICARMIKKWARGSRIQFYSQVLTFWLHLVVELTFRSYDHNRINTLLEVGLKSARKISVVQAKEAAQIIFRVFRLFIFSLVKLQLRNGHVEKWLFLVRWYTKFALKYQKLCTPLALLVPCVIKRLLIKRLLWILALWSFVRANLVRKLIERRFGYPDRLMP